MMKYFYTEMKESDFSIYSFALIETRVYKELVRNKSRVYNWVTRLLLDNINFPQNRSRIILILDKSKGKREIEEFNSYIQKQLEGKIEPEIPFEINHLDSKKDKVLQAVDLFAWGFLENMKKEIMSGSTFSKIRLNLMKYTYRKKKSVPREFSLLRLLPTRWKGTPQQTHYGLTAQLNNTIVYKKCQGNAIPQK